MKVAKRFRWEAAHRLPWHDGLCKNLHGHSYRMIVELEGAVGEHGMLVDFHDVKKLVLPLVDAWDHAILVHTSDETLMKIARETEWKHVALPFDTTVENLCAHVLEWLEEHHAGWLIGRGVTAIRVRMEETETCYAEAERTIASAADRGLETSRLSARPSTI